MAVVTLTRRSHAARVVAEAVWRDGCGRGCVEVCRGVGVAEAV